MAKKLKTADYSTPGLHPAPDPGDETPLDKAEFQLGSSETAPSFGPSNWDAYQIIAQQMAQKMAGNAPGLASAVSGSQFGPYTKAYTKPAPWPTGGISAQ